MPVDILAIAAHRDDVELTCAGTLLKAVDAGYRIGILDLTAGETGTRGSASVRADGPSGRRGFWEPPSGATADYRTLIW
jgi:LmbE family N-acetylglucosaminyl deacetylase